MLLNKRFFIRNYINKSGLFIHGRHLQIQLYKEEEREMNYSTPCSSRSVSSHPGASCSGLSQEPIFTFSRNEEMESENLSTAASRFALRSATELVADKEPRPAVATL